MNRRGFMKLVVASAVSLAVPLPKVNSVIFGTDLKLFINGKLLSEFSGILIGGQTGTITGYDIITKTAIISNG
ncbi:hypothetical protein KAR91_32395 [Candidatus Pacearchaeota archaeon]|nr:hypothetical protein [Candidatus Pacearchaeota archaeon]